LIEVLAEEKGQRLVSEVECSCDVRMVRTILRHAISNILHNAIKFTPAGKDIYILVGKETGGCFVEIADSGPGIGLDHQERIFDRFYRIDRVRSRETGGAGLGLSIAKWAVDMHDGRIDLQSEPGKGATFRIRLREVKPVLDSPTRVHTGPVPSQMVGSEKRGDRLRKIALTHGG